MEDGERKKEQIIEVVEIMSDEDKSKEDENKRIFQENFAPFHGRSKWVMIIIFSLLAFYIIASNLN